MKLQVTQENLNKALNNVARVANSRSTLPILSNVLFKTNKNRLSIAATNLDIAITHYVGAKISQEGSITIPARLTQDFVSSLPGGVIDLELEEQKLHLNAEKFQSVINGVSAEDFPVMPTINKGTEWTLDAQELKRALQQVVFAASADESRPVLTGVFFHASGGKLLIAATDSHRLAQKDLGKSKTDVQLLIPASAMHDLLRILDDQQETVTITHDDQQVLFKLGDVELVTRLIEVNYPDYQKLIPKTFTTTAKLKRTELANIAKVSSLFARESAGSITIRVDSGTVSIHSIASQLGENTASADAEVDGGGDITLNSRYLLDALGALGGETVELCFNGKLEPCVVRSTDQPDYVHLIMPLKS
jgi:DNA polymerase-3 subunit beta